MRKTTFPKLVLIAASGFLLSLLTVFMGTPFLMALRRNFGPVSYWGAGLIFSTITFPILFFVGTIWILIGAYYEVEARVNNWWVSGSISLVLSSLFGALTGIQSLRLGGIETREQFEKLLGDFILKIQEVSPGFNIEAKDILSQTPSLVLATLILGLISGIIFERRVLDWFSLPRKTNQSHKYIEFKVPDHAIWITLLAFLFVAYDFGLKALGVLGLNIVNVFAVLYFFQGIAVIECYLKFIKAGFFTRFLTYFLLVGQLFILVSILGLADFWLDFRKRMKSLNSGSENQ